MTTQTLIGALRQVSTKKPEETAFCFLEGGKERNLSITYGALHQAASAMAAEMQEQGCGQNERALLLYSPGIEYISALWGCFYAGVVAVPIYPPQFNKPSDRLGALVADADAGFALTTTTLRDRLASTIERAPALKRLTWLGLDMPDLSKPTAHTIPDAHPDDLAVLQYTSGSTGSPRGVMLSHRNLMSNITMLCTHLAATPNDRLVAWLPPYHDMGLIGTILAPVCAQLQAILMSPSSFVQRPLRWLQAIDRYKGTLSAAPDFAYELCVLRTTEAQRAALNLSNWRAALNGAERVRPETLDRFCRAFEPTGFKRKAFMPCYGLAEATLGVCMTAVGAEPKVDDFDATALGMGEAIAASSGTGSRVLVSCGPPLPKIDVVIVDPKTRRPLPDNRVGEIWVKSEGVAQGYLKKPEKTKETFEALMDLETKTDNTAYLVTGDLGFIHDNELFVTGRQKDIIILLGVNYYPEDIEATVEAAHLALHPRGTVAFSVERDGQERLVVVSEVRFHRDLPAEEIVTAIRHAIATFHALPVYDIWLVRRGQVPRTSSGKPQRRLCREQYLDNGLEVLARGDQWADPTERPNPAHVSTVARTMAEVLEVETVDEKDDFFVLGGHSLLATQLASRLEEIWNVELPLRVIFESSTPLDLAARYHSLTLRDTRKQVTPIDRQGILPLSHSQERMWFLHELEPDGAAYNVAGALIIDGSLDTSKLGSAMQLLVNRHETLRTRYVKTNGQPRPVIEAETEIAMPIEDLSDRPDPMAAAAALGSAFAHQPFDLSKSPLIRAVLYRLSTCQHAVVVSLHHIISDAWSMGVMLAEILEDYSALTAGAPLPNREDALQYVDYAAWQRQWIDGERFERERAFWIRHLKDVPVLELPTDRPRGAAPSSAGDLAPLDLSQELIGHIRELALVYDATPFMVMLLAFQVLLHRYTHQTDFTVGIPIANRNHRASEHLIGSLVNTLAIRCRLDPDATFARLLEETREVCLDAYANQDLPFERLVLELRLERRAGQSPLIQVMFDYQNPPMPVSSVADLRLKPLFISRRASQFDLSLLLMDAELGQVAGMEYRTDLFERETITRLLQHYLAILASVVVDPHQPISCIPLMSATEQVAVISLGANDSEQRMQKQTLLDRIVAQANAQPEATAVCDETGTLSYSALLAATQALADDLTRAGAGPGCRVVVCLQRSRYVPAALLAVHWIGGAYVPVDPRFPADRVRFMLTDAEPAVVLTDASSLARFREMASYPTVLLDSAPEGREVSMEMNARSDSAAYIIYTSGSTGKPKGVEIPHLALLNFLDSMHHTPGLTSADHLLSVTTVSFDIAGLELFLPLISGARVTVAPADAAMDGQKLARLLDTSGATVMQATPVTWQMLIESGWQGSKKLKILCGGEALSTSLAARLIERGESVWNMYGPTETTIWSSIQKVTSAHDITIGRPIDRTRIYILDKHRSPVPLGVRGEIYIGGAGVATGYFKRRELTASRFFEDPFAPNSDARMYATGDLGRMRGDGRFDCLGRLDHQVKVRGYRIELGEIEAAMKGVPGIRDAAATTHVISEGDTRLIAYIIVDEPVESEHLRKALNRVLPDYMIPSWFVEMEAFPKTPNGKLDRRALPLPSATAMPANRNRVLPRNETEAHLAAIWSSVLNVSDPGIHDNFFDFGHSLLAARLFARIEQEMETSLPLALLFEGPTIADLAERIRETRARSGRPQAPDYSFLVPIKPSGDRPPLYCIHGAGGNVLNLNRLATYFDADQPFYGIQTKGLDGVTTPFSTIEEMAAAYLEEVLKLQPEGPYFLSGYCGGGIVVYEMAQQLSAKNIDVAFLAMIDTYRPGVRTRLPNLRNRILAVTAQGPVYVAKRSRERLRKVLTKREQKSRINQSLNQGRPVPYEDRVMWLTDAFIEAVGGYDVRPYAGKLVLFEATDVPDCLRCAEPDLGWGGHAKGGVECYDIPGGHLTLTDEPNVRVLARKLIHCLNAAR